MSQVSLSQVSSFTRLILSVLLLSLSGLAAHAETAWVRVSQVGYEVERPGDAPARAYLMATGAEDGATFRVVDEHGTTVYSSAIGELLGTWGHSATLAYKIYALDFRVPVGEHYHIVVKGPAAAKSPVFAVASPEVLYPGLLLNSLFFYQTERDGGDYVKNALRTAPGHLKDADAVRYKIPPVDEDGDINYVPPAGPEEKAGLPNTDVEGGWWDAGDYFKFVSTTSYTVGMMETGVRDFPMQMGPEAPLRPAAPPNSISYAGDSGKGAPERADYTAEAERGVRFLLKLWDAKRAVLSLQVDNSAEWNYYGQGYEVPSQAGYCGGTYPSQYCLITEYDIWTLPQAGDHFQQDGDPEPCDPLTTFFICNRTVYVNGPPRTKVVPNAAGRLAAAFAMGYQLHRKDDPALAEQCLRAAEQVYGMADLSHPEPAGYGAGQLITAFPSYPEQTWSDDLEWGATELALALRSAGGADRLPKGLPVTDEAFYLREATHYAKRYVDLIENTGQGATLNLYDVSGLAHFELTRALLQARGDGVKGLELNAFQVRAQLLRKVDAAVKYSATDPFNLGVPWDTYDLVSFSSGISVMASEAYALTQNPVYRTSAGRWGADVLGANAWGSSFIVGDGTTFPNCIQHQVANLAGSLHGTAGGTPVLWGAGVEGPANFQSSGLVDGMRVCPANGVDTFAVFNGNNVAYDLSDPNEYITYKDDVQSYSTTEPTLDITANSFLMWSWRLAEAKQR